MNNQFKNAQTVSVGIGIHRHCCSQYTVLQCQLALMDINTNRPTSNVLPLSLPLDFKIV